MSITVNHPGPELRPDLREKLAQVGLATLGHMIEGRFPGPSIGPLTSACRGIGRAVTVKIPSPDSVLVHKATDLLVEGDVLVVDTGGDHAHAPVGGVVATAAKCRGAYGIVIDGLCADIEEIERLDLAVFARGRSVLTTRLQGIASGGINVPVSCAGVTVLPGDVVCLDRDGVLIAPASDLEEVVDDALAKDEREPETLKGLRSGRYLTELSRAGDILASLPIEYGTGRRE